MSCDRANVGALVERHSRAHINQLRSLQYYELFLADAALEYLPPLAEILCLFASVRAQYCSLVVHLTQCSAQRLQLSVVFLLSEAQLVNPRQQICARVPRALKHHSQRVCVPAG